MAQQDPLAARASKRKARLDKVFKKAGIRVEPANEDMRRVLKHPKAGAFRSSGGRMWPNDRFTQRRLSEGSVKVVAETKLEEKKPEEKKPTAPSASH